MVEVKLGVEIECVYNKDEWPLTVVGYHSRNVGDNFNGWSVSSDSSIHVHNETDFNNPGVAELVSEPCIGWEELKETLEELKVRAGGKELHQVMEFNKSMGTHIHFSTFREKEKDMVFMSLYKKLRNIVFEKVKRELPHIYPGFKKHYFRSRYAPEQKGDIIDKGMRGEINYGTVSQGTGVEWRSFNLLGVTTWDELMTMMKIAYDSIKEILEDYHRDRYKEFAELVIEDAEDSSDIDSIFESVEV